MIGRTIGKYRIVGQLGRGGAGIVYHAVDETLNRDVAIKILNPGLADTEILKRFRAEATILARLNHPQIATIYELYRADSDLLMVMECVPGETLEKIAQRAGPMPAERAASVVDQILSALEHAHRAGIVHRDMKPANVMVTPEGGVKIMDFGIARMRGAEQMTVEGRMMGTPAYMPPEQVLGQEVDGRADLYSVGVVFYRLLTGALPFAADSPIAVLQRQILETPVPLEAHRSDLPAWCEQIVQRALAKAPADRFQTAEEFREAIARGTGTGAASNELKASPVFERTDTIVMPRMESATPVLGRMHITWVHGLLLVFTLSAAGLALLNLWQSSAEDGAVAHPEPVAVARKEQPATIAAAQVQAQPAITPPAIEPHPPVRATAPSAARTPSSPVRTPRAKQVTPPPPPEPEEPSVVLPTTQPVVTEAPLRFETKALVSAGKGKHKERDAHLSLAEGKITVTSDDQSPDELFSFPYASVISITYSRGRDPMWNSPQGPAPVARAGGKLGRLGIFVGREWVALRTSTTHQFVAMRFDDVLVRRVLLALEERTGRKPQFIAERKDGQ
jgi:serine/threonine protein kinase